MGVFSNTYGDRRTKEYTSGLSRIMAFILKKDLREKSEQCLVEENYFSVPAGRQK